MHRLVGKRKLFLGGIVIPSKLGTLGHSDGDPVLHAIIDSLLGPCSLGDIGEKFSDKSKKFKNIKSSVLLKNVLNQMQPLFCSFFKWHMKIGTKMTLAANKRDQ